jgi:hypothetical protein
MVFLKSYEFLKRNGTFFTERRKYGFLEFDCMLEEVRLEMVNPRAQQFHNLKNIYS